MIEGKITRISGPVVDADGMTGATLYEVARVGNEQLIGEIIRIVGDIATIQVYEPTDGLKPGEPVIATGKPLTVQLGPGILEQIYDGIQRPLPVIQAQKGAFIERGIEVPGIDFEKKWDMKIKVKVGDKVEPGDIIAVTQETSAIEHRIMIPPDKPAGTVKKVVPDGEYTVDEVLVVVETKDGSTYEVKGYHEWPVRRPRPFKKRLGSEIPLLTGQRIFDTFFPIAKGGTAAIPGPFGTGKCVSGDTPVLLENGETIEIKDIFEMSIKNGIIEEDNEIETLVRLNKPLRVIGFDRKTGTQKIVEATHAYKGYSDYLLRITTKKGRTISLTPIHKLQMFDGTEIVEKPAGELKIGDYLVTPRRLIVKPNNEQSLIEIAELDQSLRATNPEALVKMQEAIQKLKEEYGTLKKVASILGTAYDVLINYYKERASPTILFLKRLEKESGVQIPISELKGERQSHSVTIPQKMNEELAEFLGLLLSDGMLKGKYGVYFFNNSPILRSRFETLASRLFNVSVTHSLENTVETVSFSSKPIRVFLEHLGIPTHKKSRNCRIPAILLNSSIKIVSNFLAAYIAGDGYVSGYTLEISTSSEGMAHDLSYLLSRLGIIYRIRRNDANYRLVIEGKELELLGSLLENTYPYPRIQRILEYKENNDLHFIGTDIVPISSNLLQEIKRKTLTTKPSVNSYDNIVYSKQNLTRRSLNKLIDGINDESYQEVKERLQHIDKILEEFYFDQIAKIELIEGPMEVFDLSVPELHNFIGGKEPLILHNTVSQHQLARWGDAQIVVYVGCGERGNEMTQVLEEFPHLDDPHTGLKLMTRTALIANTSNMPVAAREASVYTGITLAEYYRDMGYDVSIQADSTSRWAEAMREISGRLEEMPGEEGYPAYLASRIAEYYERSGRVVCIGSDDRVGSVTVVGAVSPPGGDFSEPVTQNTLRIVKVFWALTKTLAAKRHFPAISYLDSYTLYWEQLESFYRERFGQDFPELRAEAFRILQQDNELQEIVQLVGPDALPPSERIVLEAGRIIKEDFLQQNAFHDADSYCSPEKQYLMLKAIILFYEKMREMYEQGVDIKAMIDHDIVEEIARMKYVENEKAGDVLRDLISRITSLKPEDFVVTAETS